MMPLKNLLKDALHRKSVTQGVRAVVVLDAAREALEIFPNETRQRILPVSFREDTLTFSVNHPALIQEIRMREQEILMSLAERFGPIVTKIRISLTRQQNDEMLG